MHSARLASITLALAGAVVLVFLAQLGGATRLLNRARADLTPDLRLITFNFDGGNREHRAVRAWLRERSPDVVLIQETYALAGEAIPGMRDVMPFWMEQQTRAGYRGVSLLSRYPLSGHEGYDQEYPYSRAVVSLPAGDVAVYNVALANPVNPRTGAFISSPLDLLSGYDTSQRDQQIGALLERLERETLPVIVAGDFNMMEIEGPYGWLADAGLRDVFAAVGQGGGATWRVPSPLLLRIDYAWASPALCPISASLGPILGSDHLPLETALALEPCT